MFPITIAITRLLKKKPNEYLITTHEVNKEACDQIVVTLRDKFGNDIGSNVINITPTNINTGDYWIVIFHGLTVEIDYLTFQCNCRYLMYHIPRRQHYHLRYP